MPARGRLRIGLVVLTLLAPAACWAGWRWREAKRLRRAVASARADIQAARFATARRNLERLLSRHPGSDAVVYLLGHCERRTGRSDAATGYWSRVPPGSPFAPQAVQGRMELEIERGRLAEAERIVEQAASDPRADGTGLRLYLGQLYSQEGRMREAAEIIEARWEHLRSTGEGTSEPSLNLLRLSIELRSSPTPEGPVREFLDQMSRLAPGDDRVWLGRARLAIRTGTHEEADRLLRECERARPDDLAVRGTRLDWAVATENVDEALRAFEGLPARWLSPAETGRLAAWLFQRRGDRAREHRALELLTQADPDDLAARGRLRELSTPDGPTDGPDTPPADAAEIDRMRTRFRQLHRRNQPFRDAAELGRLAMGLGRWLEARGYLALAVATDPDRAEVREDLRSLEATLGDLESRRDAVAGQITEEARAIRE